MALAVVTAESREVLRLEEAMNFLKLPNGHEDTHLVETLMRAVHEQAKTALKRQLVSTTYDLSFRYLEGDRGAHGDLWRDRRIYLPRPPLSSVTSVKYIDSSDVEQTVATSVYRVETPSSGQGFIALEHGESWPADQRGWPDDVTIRFVAGYGTRDDVPESIKVSMLRQLAALYENREDGTRTPAWDWYDRMPIVG